MIGKKLNITKEEINKWQSSIGYKWIRWYQYTWVGKIWYSIKGGIPSLIKWTKIAWVDRDWDYKFIYDTLRFKLENTLKYIDKHKRSINYKQDVFWMQTCVNLIDKINGDDMYIYEYLDYQETEWRFEDVEDNDELSEMHVDVIEDNFDDYFEKYPLWKIRAIDYIKENKHRYTVDHSDRNLVARIMGRLRHENAKKLLFKILEVKIEHFWD